MAQKEISEYITEINRIFKAGNATEHSYRPALLRLLENMFAARLHDTQGGEGGDAFTRVKAAQLIPQSNPFLRKLFQYIAGFDLDSRIKQVVPVMVVLGNPPYSGESQNSGGLD